MIAVHAAAILALLFHSYGVFLSAAIAHLSLDRTCSLLLPLAAGPFFAPQRFITPAGSPEGMKTVFSREQRALLHGVHPGQATPLSSSLPLSSPSPLVVGGAPSFPSQARGVWEDHVRGHEGSCDYTGAVESDFHT